MWQKSARYLDYNAGAGLTETVRKKLSALLLQEGGSDDFFFANPSSRHRSGQKAQQALFRASEKVAKSLGVASDDLVFVSSGTEANQTVIRSGFRARVFSDSSSLWSSTTGLIIGSGEHSASHDLIAELSLAAQDSVFELSLLRSGHYNLQELQNLLIAAQERGLKEIFLSLFWANNETGVLTNLSELKKVLEQSPIPVSLHLDGAQAWGKLPTRLLETPADYITFSAHKIGAPAGTGVIWVRPGKNLHSLIPGAQARGRRGGTENLLGVLATGFAAEEVNSEKFSAHTLGLRETFERELKASGVPVLIWGEEMPRISNTTRFSFLNEQMPESKTYENWVELLDLRGFSVSHGSACKSQVIEPSRVLLAMGATPSEALNSIRVSFGTGNTLNDAIECVRAIQSIHHRKNPISAGISS